MRNLSFSNTWGICLLLLVSILAFFSLFIENDVFFTLIDIILIFFLVPTIKRQINQIKKATF